MDAVPDINDTVGLPRYALTSIYTPVVTGHT